MSRALPGGPREIPIKTQMKTKDVQRRLRQQSNCTNGLGVANPGAGERRQRQSQAGPLRRTEDRGAGGELARLPGLVGRMGREEPRWELRPGRVQTDSKNGATGGLSRAVRRGSVSGPFGNENRHIVHARELTQLAAPATPRPCSPAGAVSLCRGLLHTSHGPQHPLGTSPAGGQSPACMSG